jgi:hypothetical protein
MEEITKDHLHQLAISLKIAFKSVYITGLSGEAYPKQDIETLINSITQLTNG